MNPIELQARVMLLLLAGAWPVLASGCAAVKATQQPAKRDMAVLDSGVPRTHVIAELGAPVWSGERDGVPVDVFTFKQGYAKTTKAARALVHGAADVATFGLWEVVGIPAETLADGTDVQLEVSYDSQQKVERVDIIKGEKAVHPPKLFARQTHTRPAKRGHESSDASVATKPRREPLANTEKLGSAEPPVERPLAQPNIVRDFVGG